MFNQGVLLNGLILVLQGLLVTFIVIFVLSIIYGYRMLGYWSKRELPTLNPTFPFGDARKMVTGEWGLLNFIHNAYDEFKKRGLKHGGLYFFCRPFYIPLDPDIIKNIVQKDFDHFVNRGNYVDENADPLSAHLFNLYDSKWKTLRNKLTPTFTSGKMKMMFGTMIEISEILKSVLEDKAKDGTPVEIKEVASRFTSDVVVSIAFGIKGTSLTNPDCEFYKYGHMTFNPTGLHYIKQTAAFLVSDFLLSLVKMKATPDAVENFFMTAIKNTVKFRETNKIHRNDFMHLLLQLKNRGELNDDGEITENGKIREVSLTLDELVAQAFLFYIGSFETSSTSITFTLFELSKNQDIQNKLRNEINLVLAKHDNQITYEAIIEMIYLEQVFNETLRKYTPGVALLRICNKDYEVPNMNFTIEKGTMVIIPVLALHRDPDHFPDPDVFEPERFSAKNRKKIKPFTFLPFGEGPRICIGLRYGALQYKVALITIIRNFKITLNRKTRIPLTFSTKSFVPVANGGMWLNMKPI